jgi:23S rRNA pseudouridine1911/1915/1917 synthase
MQERDTLDIVGERRLAVPPQAAGWRLDRAMGLLAPEIGLRGRRRLIEAGCVLLDGRPRGAAYRVRAGAMLTVTELPRPEGTFTAADVPVVVEAGDYAVVSKPAGLHSAAIAHGGGESLEDLLPAIFPGKTPVLLSRLDRLTTGIVPVALTPEAAVAYRRLEAVGQVAKTYLAVAHGVVTVPFAVTLDLDVRDRAKTRVRFRETPDPLRHTEAEPVERMGGLVLLRCRIARGARHQIRAHLAASGHPIVGDPLYGRGEGGRLFLHCASLRCAVLAVDNDPPWSLSDAAEVVRTQEIEKDATGDGRDKA